ncbi:hypothetical protein Tco_0348546 [Tanacetum coccineum]
MSTANQQTLAKAGSEGRPRLLEKGIRRKVQDPKYPSKLIDEPEKDLSVEDMDRYYADIKVMNYILQGIPNDIYNFVDACQDAQAMWNHVRRLMQDIDLMDDYDDDSQGEIQGDAQEDKLSTIMMLLARAITQHFSTPTNNRLCTSSNKRNQTVIQDGHMDIQSKNNVESYENVQWNPRTTSTLGKTIILLAMKDEVGVHLDAEENDFMRMSAYGKDRLEECNASMIMMEHIQSINNESDVEPTYDAEVISEVNASQINLINVLL